MSRKSVQRKKHAQKAAARRNRLIVGGFIGLIVVIAGLFAFSRPGSDEPDVASLEVAPRVGARAPDFTLPDTTGQNISLSDFRGKPVAMMFFHSW